MPKTESEGGCTLLLSVMFGKRQPFSLVDMMLRDCYALMDRQAL